jgi:uncharacterized RDD family membrane protein YckC
VAASPYAGLVSRTVALVLDGLVVTLLVLIVATLPEATWSSLSPTTVPRWLEGVTSAVAFAVPLVYFSALWAMTGQTAGGLATGTVVEHRDGFRLSFPHALARAVVGLAFAPLWVVGMLAIVANRERRAWHDLLTRTDVRYASSRSPGRRPGLP